jgi:outer membrane protein assembly factor BamB
MKSSIRCLAVAVGLGWSTLPATAQDFPREEASWPQFRGPNGSGVAPDGMKLPVHFGPTQKVLWKTALPSGYSSPCIGGDHIFLTAFDPAEKKLETLCLDRRSGQVRWRRTAPAKHIEKVHRASSPASSTPATDGERVYVYFGSFGLLCYDRDGKEQWQLPLPTPKTENGTATSPVLAGELLLLKGQGQDSFLLAVNRKTGAVVWKKDPLPFDAGYALPILLSEGARTEVVLFGTGGVKAYDLKDGTELWSVNGLLAAAIPTPIFADGLLFVLAEFASSGIDDPNKILSFDDLLKKYDTDKDGRLSREEAKDIVLYRGSSTGEGDIKLLEVFDWLDRNKDGKIDQDEWKAMFDMIAKADDALVAIRPGGTGDVTKTHVAWKYKRSLPDIASPVAYASRLYLVKNDGIVTCLEPAADSPKVVYRERLGVTGLYYASPVAGDGKVYAASGRGMVVVFAAGDKFQVLARNDLHEPILATPALADGKLYVRTEGHLYAFGE